VVFGNTEQGIKTVFIVFVSMTNSLNWKRQIALAYNELLGARFNGAKHVLYEAPTYLAQNLN
jgi:hypothetical protein